MSVSLVNDFIRKTNLISKVSSSGETQWFKGMSFTDILLTFFLPIVLAIIAGFMFKKRYEERQARLAEIPIDSFESGEFGDGEFGNEFEEFENEFGGD